MQTLPNNLCKKMNCFLFLGLFFAIVLGNNGIKTICHVEKMQENEYKINCTSSASDCCILTKDCLNSNQIRYGNCKKSINSMKDFIEMNDTILNQVLDENNGCTIIVNVLGKQKYDI